MLVKEAVQLGGKGLIRRKVTYGILNLRNRDVGLDFTELNNRMVRPIVPQDLIEDDWEVVIPIIFNRR